MGSLLFRRILNSKKVNARSVVSVEMVLSYWNRNMRGLGYAERLFRVLLKQHKDNDENVLRDDDLRPLWMDRVDSSRSSFSGRHARVSGKIYSNVHVSYFLQFRRDLEQ